MHRNVRAQRPIDRFGWWTPPEIHDSPERFVPERMDELLAKVITDGPPDIAVEGRG